MASGDALDLARPVAGWCLIVGSVLYAAYRAWRRWASVPDAPSARQRHRLARLDEPDRDDHWAQEVHFRVGAVALLVLCFLLGCALVL